MKIAFSKNEISLVGLCKKGNEKAQFELYKLYSKSMYNVALRMTGDRGTAEDILQDAFIKAFSEINKIKDEKAFGGWLKRIAINCCIDEARKKRVSFSFNEILSGQHFEIAEEVEDFTNPEVVHHLIKKLPDGARQILVLHALEGLKHAEIGKQLGISESTVKTQFFRAKKLLGKMITESEHETGFGEIFRKEPAGA